MWNYFSPEDLQWYSWNLDGARAWLRKNGEEWRLALQEIEFKTIQPGSQGPTPAVPPSELSIFFGVGKGKRIALRPQLAQRPYVIAARNNVRLLPGAEAQFDIALPPLLRFELEDGKVLLEAEPFTVPNTWFGDKTSGNLCLSLPMSLDPRCAGEKQAPEANSTLGTHNAERYLSCHSLIQCRLIIKNQSKEPINLDRLAIFTDLINVYQKGEFMVTDNVVIVATQDGELQTRIEKAKSPGLAVLQSARSSGISEILVRRGVSFLKRVAGIEPV